MCVHALLKLALEHGNDLRSSWKYVLECISKLDYL